MDSCTQLVPSILTSANQAFRISNFLFRNTSSLFQVTDITIDVSWTADVFSVIPLVITQKALQFCFFK